MMKENSPYPLFFLSVCMETRGLYFLNDEIWVNLYLDLHTLRCYLVCLSPRAAVAKCHKLVCLERQKFILAQFGRLEV